MIAREGGWTMYVQFGSGMPTLVRCEPTERRGQLRYTDVDQRGIFVRTVTHCIADRKKKKEAIP